VIGKEIRQNLVFMALVIALGVILYGRAEYGSSGLFAFRVRWPLSILLIGAIRSAIPVICAMAGLVLGICQPIWDANFDRWAFLTHRPVSRSVLFTGRAAAGLAMYGIVCGIPLLLLLLIAISPIGGTLFRWVFFLPPIVGFAAGLAYYFAGFLISDREGRLYGSRVAPLIVPVAMSVFAARLPTFWEALIATIAATIVLAIGAWGSSISHGYRLRSPLAGRIATRIVILAALSVLLIVPAEQYHEKIASARSGLEAELRHPILNSSHELLKDGRIIVETPIISATTGKRDIVYTDEHGQPVSTPEAADYPPSATAATSVRNADRLSYTMLDRVSLISMSSMEPSALNNREAMRWWESHSCYFDATRNIFLIYSQPESRNALVGTLGANGFAAAPGWATPFDRPQSYGHYLLTPRALYSIDMRGGKAAILCEAQATETFTRLEFFYGHASGHDEWIDRLALSTESVVYILDGDGHNVVRLPLPANVLFVRVSLIAQTSQWVETYNNRTDASNDYSSYFDFYSDKGQLVRHEEFKNYAATLFPPSIEQVREGRMLAAADGALAGIADPLLAGIVDLMDWRHFRFEDINFVYPDYLIGGDTLHRWPAIVVLAAVLLICALLAWPLAKAYRLDRSWPWMILALITGPAALLALIATCTLPQRIKCPNCHARRPITDPVCPNCKAPWPAPVQTGTEIFT
jgi:hypothetical protein